MGNFKYALFRIIVPSCIATLIFGRSELHAIGVMLTCLTIGLIASGDLFSTHVDNKEDK